MFKHEMDHFSKKYSYRPIYVMNLLFIQNSYNASITILILISPIYPSSHNCAWKNSRHFLSARCSRGSWLHEHSKQAMGHAAHHTRKRFTCPKWRFQFSKTDVLRHGCYFHSIQCTDPPCHIWNTSILIHAMESHCSHYI